MKRLPIWLEGRQTVGGLVQRQSEIRATCRSCSYYVDVDLDQLLAVFGASERLLDRTGQCPECGGVTRLLCSQGSCAPFMPLSSP